MSGGILPVIARDRIWEAFRALVRLETQQARYLGTYEYTIQATDGSTVSATSNDTSTGMPDVSQAELRADTIATQVPSVGQLCHIVFVDGNPAKPKCVWCQPSPVSASIAGGSHGILRSLDSLAMGTLTAGPYTVTQTVPPSAMTPGSAIVVMGGSSKVTCG